MDHSVEEIQPNVWRVNIGGIVRVVRYRKGNMTFAPWDVTSAEGRTLWSAPSLESAFRWIQARTGLPTEALLVEGLLEQTASNKALENPQASGSVSEQEESASPAPVRA